MVTIKLNELREVTNVLFEKVCEVNECKNCPLYEGDGKCLLAIMDNRIHDAILKSGFMEGGNVQ